MRKKEIFLTDFWEHTKKLLKVMKLSSIFLLVSIIQISANVLSQETRINLKIMDGTISEIFNEIEIQSDYKVFYNVNQIDLSKRINYIANNKPISGVLGDVLGNLSVSYELYDKIIVIVPDELKQSQTITGTVTDASTGEPLPGVNVIVSGTTIGVITDLQGKYNINIPNTDVLLEFSFVGYLSEKVSVAKQTVIDIKLSPDIKKLDEVVVVGYGTQKKLTVTGSVVDTKGEELIKSPATNLTSTLQGRLPGLIASNRSGEPGRDDAVLAIRGKSTTGDNSPLVIIDGVERSGLGQIDSKDIESVSVLKDASAAIYGARGANGVILVTTKRGSTGKAKFDFSFNQAYSQPTRLPDLMDAVLFATVRNEADARNKVALTYSQEDMQMFKDGTDPIQHANTNWLNETLKDWAPQTKMNLSVNGGNERVKYYFSFGYQNQDGNFKYNPTNFEMFNLRSNIDATINSNLTISLDLAGRMENRYYPSTDTWTNFVNILSADPTLPVRYPTGEIAPGRLGESPLFRDQCGYDKIDNIPITTALSVKYDVPFIEGLTFSGTYNFDIRNQFEKLFQKPYYFYQYNSSTHGYDYKRADIFPTPTVKDQFNRWLVSTYNIKANYNKSFGKHNVGLLLGWEQSHARSNWTSAYSKNIVSPTLPQVSSGSISSSDWAIGGNAGEEARDNYFGRLNYNFNEKYLAELLFRYDGSTKFPKKGRYGFFPGVSLGWRVSEENFIKNNLSIVSNLKLRASYGEMGNDRIDAYQYLSTFSIGDNYTFGGTDVPGVTPGVLPNGDVTWEVARITNFGLDLSLWRSLISISFDYFIQKRSNILWAKQQSIPNTMGFPSLPPENIGKVDNHGFEIVLTHHNKIGNVGYNVGANMSFARNKIVFIDETPLAAKYQEKTGHPIGSQLIYGITGIYQDQAQIDSVPHPNAQAYPGDAIYLDYNKDGKIDANDQYMSERSTFPEIIYGFDLGLNYKNLDISLFFQGQANAVIYPGITSLGGTNNQVKYRADNRWTADNRSAKLPGSGGAFPQNSTLNEYSAAFIRLKTMEIGYTLPKSLTSKAGLVNCRIYMNAFNVFTISELDFMDPELDPAKSDMNNYPQLRTFNVGVNLTF